MSGKLHSLTVWGDLACFTRPELKVERMSYPVITPSAARGIFDAICWKPDASFYWQVQRIEILKQPRFIALRRNEVKNRAPSEHTIMAWAEGRAVPEPLWADGGMDPLGDDEKGRTQRQTMALCDVEYRLHARMRSEQSLASYDAQFARRAKNGQCFSQPYLGCREFVAYFELSDPAHEPPPIALDLDLGLMLYDVFALGTANSQPSISLFRARIENGVLEVPDYQSDLVLKGLPAL